MTQIKFIPFTTGPVPFNIEAGVYKVADLKAMLGYPAEYQLTVIRNGQILSLNDESVWSIVPDEVYSARPQSGALA